MNVTIKARNYLFVLHTPTRNLPIDWNISSQDHVKRANACKSLKNIVMKYYVVQVRNGKDRQERKKTREECKDNLLA